MKNKILVVYEKKKSAFSKMPLMNDQFTDLIKQNLTNKSVVLDIGCGGGRLSISINDYAKKVIGIDFSNELIKQANAHAKRANIEYKVMDGEHLKFKEEMFDMIVSHAAINKRMCRAEIALKGAYKVLKPNGKLIIKIIYSTWGEEFGFKGGYDEREIKRILKSIGYKNINIKIQKEKCTARSYDNIKWLRDTEAACLSSQFEKFMDKSKKLYMFDDSFMTIYAEKI